ncbi:restriction endonuclease subunit S [Vibrio cholerae]|uniref:restriction endonuclease subunit S n=1 Tax=Vibrio cholerae TaxID=666 RepID=UPI0011589391|nr:restriction endonuclease subunit S [Vibrio cholerae]TQP83649.1 restriction endonuclease subunit S [Vibrio cholerae]
MESITSTLKYDQYSDSGYEWIGEIPEHWDLVKLGSCLSPVSVKNCPELPLLSITREQGVIERDVDNQESNHNFIPDDLSGYKKLEKGQFGMNKMKAWQGSYGVSKFTGIVSPAYFVFDFTKAINPEFFNWAIRSKLYVSFFGSASDGVRIGQWDLSKTRMKVIPFVLPSEEEQSLIANFLDKKATQINDAIAIKEQQISLLKERKQIIIQQAVTQGLDPNVPMKDSGVDWIGKIPEHWDITKISNITNTTSGSTPQSGNVEAYYNGNIPWVRTTDLNDDLLFDTPEKITYKALRETSCKLVPEESVCVAMYGGAGTIGKHALLKFSGTVNQAVCAILPCHKLVPKFLYYYVKFYRPHWMIVAKGSRVDPNISQDQVRRMPITLPSILEQTAIVDFINDQLGMFNDAEGFYLQQIEKLKEYKTTLINSAVTGKIKITPEMVEQ